MGIGYTVSNLISHVVRHLTQVLTHRLPPELLIRKSLDSRLSTLATSVSRSPGLPVLASAEQIGSNPAGPSAVCSLQPARCLSLRSHCHSPLMKRRQTITTGTSLRQAFAVIALTRALPSPM